MGIKAQLKYNSSIVERPAEITIYGTLREDGPDKIQRLAERLAVTDLHSINPRVLGMALGWYIEGRNWMLKQFNHAPTPPTYIGEFTDQQGQQLNSTLLLPDGPVVVLQKATLKQLVGLTPADFESIRYVFEAGFIKYRLSLAQYFGQLGIQETCHALASLGIYDLKEIPATEKVLDSDTVGPVRYLLQPHEQEALTYAGRFLKVATGKNPYRKLELYLRLRSLV